MQKDTKTPQVRLISRELVGQWATSNYHDDWMDIDRGEFNNVDEARAWRDGCTARSMREGSDVVFRVVLRTMEELI